MFDWIKCVVREFLGIPQMQSRLAECIEGVRRVVAWQKENAPVLACVTICCDTEEGGKTVRTTFGGECFLSPGQRHTLTIPCVHHTVARCTYFVSGHPNIVITDFVVGSESKRANECGTKFGQCDFVLEVGNRLQVRLEYRVPGQSL